MYTLLTSQLFPIYNELRDRSQKNMNSVIVASIGSAAACYEIVSYVEVRDTHSKNQKLTFDSSVS